MSVATVPWTNSPPIRGGFHPGGSAGIGFEYGRAQWRLKLQDVEEINGATKVIAYHTAKKGWQSELVLIDVDDKEWFPGGAVEISEGLLHLSGTCNLPLSRIKEAHLRVRPYEAVEFRNVSVQPGERTGVEIADATRKAESPGTPFTTPVEHSKPIETTLTKSIAASKVTEDGNRVQAWTDSSFPAGEAVVATIKRPDGRLEEAMTQTMTIRGLAGRQTATVFSWQMGDDFDFETRKATLLEARRNIAIGRSILLEAGKPFFLFAETNRAGGTIEGYLEFRPIPFTTALIKSSEQPIQASVRFSSVTNVNRSNMPLLLLGFFNHAVPPGHVLEVGAMESGGEETETHTSIAHSASYNAGDCRWNLPEGFTTGQLQSATGQLEKLKQMGSILVPSGKRIPLFTVTNAMGATYQGFFELLAPGPESNSKRVAKQRAKE